MELIPKYRVVVQVEKWHVIQEAYKLHGTMPRKVHSCDTHREAIMVASDIINIALYRSALALVERKGRDELHSD